MQSSPILLSGTTVIIKRYRPRPETATNLSIVEILAAAGAQLQEAFRARISPYPTGNVATVVLSQNGRPSQRLLWELQGRTLRQLGNGTYTLTPSETGFTFTPASQSVTVSGNAVTVPVFTATAVVRRTPFQDHQSGTQRQRSHGSVVAEWDTVAMTTVGASVPTPSATSLTQLHCDAERDRIHVTPTAQSVTVNGNPVTVPSLLRRRWCRRTPFQGPSVRHPTAT